MRHWRSRGGLHNIPSLSHLYEIPSAHILRAMLPFPEHSFETRAADCSLPAVPLLDSRPPRSLCYVSPHTISLSALPLILCFGAAIKTDGLHNPTLPSCSFAPAVNHIPIISPSDLLYTLVNLARVMLLLLPQLALFFSAALAAPTLPWATLFDNCPKYRPGTTVNLFRPEVAAQLRPFEDASRDMIALSLQNVSRRNYQFFFIQTG